jgi:hypothetical protein
MATRAAHGIDLTAACGSGEAATVAGLLLDIGSPITLNSANYTIDLVDGGTDESAIRAIGSFTNGNAGGQLPNVNQLNPQNPILPRRNRTQLRRLSLQRRGDLG